MGEKHKILIVDDDHHTLDALTRVFWKEYEVLSATSAKEGLKILGCNPVSVIICDQRMPEMTGTEMLEKSIAVNPDAVRILITAYSDIEAVISAINEGKVFHFETKPWDSERLKNIVKKGLELYEAHEKLKTLDQAKTSFLNVISHALRTPLTTILGFTETLLSDLSLNKDDKNIRVHEREGGGVFSHVKEKKYHPLSEQKSQDDKTALEYIHKAAHKLLRMAEDVILLTTLEAQTHKIQKHSIDLKCLIERTLSHFDTLIQGQKIKLTLHMPELLIKGDEKLLQSLCDHLIENALLYNKNGGTLTIEGSSENNKVRLLIENTTQNLSQKDFKNIFEKLHNPQNMKHHHGGLGLGLPLVGLIIKTLEGSLTFHKKDKTLQTIITF